MAGNSDKRDVAAAFIIGGLFGAGIALLLAPQSGARTRRDIRRVGEKAANMTQAARTEIGRSIDNLTDGVLDKLQEEFDRGREWTEDAVAQLQKAINSGKEFIRGEIDKITRG
jgi:gas vesicle protein